MEQYIYSVLKEFAINFKDEFGVRPGQWDCICYMAGYNPNEILRNIYDVIHILYDEELITYSVSGDGWGALSPSPVSRETTTRKEFNP